MSLFLKHFNDKYDDNALLLLLIKLSHDQSQINLVNELAPRECPIGFQFYNIIHQCDCSHVLQNFGYQPICTISSDGHNPLITITLPVTTLSHWIGVIKINNVTSFSVSTACYLYCNFNSKYNTYMINESDNFIHMMDSDKPSYKESLCLKNRTGALCSQCAPGYSVVFGSSDCIRCSNWWLLTLIIYGVAG